MPLAELKLKMKSLNQVLVYADDIILMGENINVMKRMQKYPLSEERNWSGGHI
jgi:hypothetical protein